MGESAASVASRERMMDVDFALIGHQESWRAASDVLAVLRGPQRMPLPDDEIKDILPWIPPRAVCHVEVGSITGAKARGFRSITHSVPIAAPSGVTSGAPA